MRKGKFCSGLDANKRKPIERAIFIISHNKEEQNGVNFEAYINLINRHHTVIRELYILPAGYNYRHYSITGKHDAENHHQEFITDHNVYIENCKVPVKIINWQFLIEEENYASNHQIQLHCSYKDAVKFIETKFMEDAEFQSVFNEIAKEKAEALAVDFASAEKYLREECAVTYMLPGMITYPGDPNSALEHIFKYYSKHNSYKKYKLTGKDNSQDELLETVLKMSTLLERNGIYKVESKILCLHKILEAVNECKDKKENGNAIQIGYQPD